jgi:hypothetical protein
MRHRRPAFFLLTFALAACQSVSASPPVPPSATAPATTESTARPSASPTVPSATETLAAAPRDFTEEFDGTPGYWEFRQADNGQPAVPPKATNGFLIFDLPEPNQWVYDLYSPQDYADVRVDARVEIHADKQGAAGVICRYREQTGWYEFEIYPDQTYVLLFGQWLAEGVTRYTPIVRDVSEKIHAGQNEIGLSCEGDILTPFINGTQMRKREEKTFQLAGGKVGISASSFENGAVSIAYDWVKVSEP